MKALYDRPHTFLCISSLSWPQLTISFVLLNVLQFVATPNLTLHINQSVQLKSVSQYVVIFMKVDQLPANHCMNTKSYIMAFNKYHSGYETCKQTCLADT